MQSVWFLGTWNASDSVITDLNPKEYYLIRLLSNANLS
jgi:hypothetical protein